MSEPKRSTRHWVWWTPINSMWSDFWVMDDYGNLQRVHFDRMKHFISLNQ